MKIILLLCAGYLLGSIPVGFIVAKTLCGVDIRKTGSGNIGATNVLRTIGTGPAIAVFALDVTKGLLPTLAAGHFAPGIHWLAVLSGMAAVLGHTLSIFLGFKGGKGVATSLGVAVGLNPVIALIGFIFWAVMVAVSRYVSVASILAVIAVSLMFWLAREPLIYSLFISLASLYVITKHRENIARLLQGREARWGEKANKTEG